ncbi:CLUMA_CG011106, isoform A [Clunio marinus]|uniref:CLUMA_CG011106, isoform A n=1 Tax=Clunio marinus TaxID=568069 RepID=A0A1J1IFF0_9DIPT|nr:CLUMA_CG011106, isoform A [Clunio marinus]
MLKTKTSLWICYEEYHRNVSTFTISFICFSFFAARHDYKRNTEMKHSRQLYDCNSCQMIVLKTENNPDELSKVECSNSYRLKACLKILLIVEFSSSSIYFIFELKGKMEGKEGKQEKLFSNYREFNEAEKTINSNMTLA